jgi:hypothetical protein
MVELRRANDERFIATTECLEQARLLGISAESELRWRARAERAEKELADLRAMVLDGLAEMGQTLGMYPKPEVDE